MISLDPKALEAARKAFWRSKLDSVEAAIRAYLKAIQESSRETRHVDGTTPEATAPIAPASAMPDAPGVDAPGANSHGEQP